MRGLLAIEPLYHQIVAGRKTQTRRSGGLDMVNENPNEWELDSWVRLAKGLQVVEFMRPGDRSLVIQCTPRYKVGEVLYLKEPYIINTNGEIFYKFNNQHHSAFKIEKHWKNKLFMPASAARAFIRITGIKCERLLDISDEDCIAEGIESTNGWIGSSANDYLFAGTRFTGSDFRRRSFISLYQFANKMKPTAEIPNIWVWAYTFEYLPDYKL